MSVDRHLGCFHVLAVVNSAAVTTVVHVSFQVKVYGFFFFFFFGICPGMELLDPMVVLFLVS